MNINVVSGTDRFELYRETAGLGGFDASEVAYDKLPSKVLSCGDGALCIWYGGPNSTRLVFA